MKNKDTIKVSEFVGMAEELTPEHRTELIRELLRQQRRLSDEKPDKENATLIDIRRGLIAGSSVCPVCEGYLGRAPDYED